MPEPTYRVTTLGCRVNRSDSLDIEKQFAARGYVRAASGQVPDIWVLNTCAVTGEGMRKSRKAARRCAASGARVIVTGCAVDMNPSELRVDGVEAVYSNKDKAAIVEDACAGTSFEARQVAWSPEDLVRVPIKVQEGCNRYCSYCIVPYLRPGQYSRAVEEIQAEVSAAVEAGAGEVILCGIDLGSYCEPTTGSGIDSLARAVAEAAGDAWVRLSSIELFDVGDGVVDLMRQGMLSRHLHVPLQSGDSGVLAAMRRKYEPSDFAARVGELKESVKGLAVTSDVLVGFPTEDEQAYENTRELVEAMGFSRLHVFKYSRREGTKAFALGDPVRPEEKARRASELRALARTLASRFHADLVGRIIEVLTEGSMESEPGSLFGRAESFAGVIFPGGPELIGKVVRVRVTSSGPAGVRGEITTGSGPGEGECIGR